MSKDTVLKFLLPHFLPVLDDRPETVSLDPSLFMTLYVSRSMLSRM